jgi:hypothetical protein
MLSGSSFRPRSEIVKELALKYLDYRMEMMLDLEDIEAMMNPELSPEARCTTENHDLAQDVWNLLQDMEGILDARGWLSK